MHIKDNNKLKLAKLTILAFVLVNFGLLFLYNSSSIFLTVSLYIVLLWASILAVKKLVFDPKLRSNILLMVGTVLVMLFFGEMSLRYVAKMNLTYSEKNGRIFSPLTYGVTPLAFSGSNKHLLVSSPYFVKQRENQEFSYQHAYNSLGMRSPEPAKDSAVFTILALGDSFTEGVGTPSDSTWVSLMEKKLSMACPAMSVQAINAGKSGSDPFFEYNLLREMLKSFQIDRVVVSINETDIDDVILRGGMERFGADGSLKYSSGPWWQYVYHASYIFRGIIHGFTELDFLLLTPEQREHANYVAVKQIANCFENEYIPLAEKHGFELLVVINRMQYELEHEPFPFNPIMSLDNGTSLRVLDLYPTFMRAKESMPLSALYWPIDLHNTSNGYQLWADAVADAISKPSICN